MLVAVLTAHVILRQCSVFVRYAAALGLSFMYDAFLFANQLNLFGGTTYF